MSKQINVNIRMDKDTKERADALFNALGFNFTTAVNTFIKQALREQAIPFQPRLLKNPLDGIHDEREKSNLEIERREAWLKKLNNSINLSADETIIDIPRSEEMREPVNLSE